MKKEILLDLDHEQSRPVVLSAGINALYDSGSDIPMCFSKPSVLTSVYNAKLVLRNRFITGFGGKAYGDIYVLECFQLKELLYPNMHVFVPYEYHSEFRFLLSASMFHGLIYEINTKQHTMTIKIPDDESNVRNLRIIDANGDLHALCTGV